NTMVDQLSAFADEVTRVAREVGTEGKLGGQAEVKGVSGTWRALTDSVNWMADNLTDQVRNIAQVTTAVAQGDVSQTITVDARIGAALQGQRDLAAVSRLIMSELTPLVDAQVGAFFMAEARDGVDPVFRLLAGYGVKPRRVAPYRLGEGLIGQAALEKKIIVL